MFWQECLEKGFVRKSTPDKELAKSLLKMAETRLHFIKSIIIEQSNASIITGEAYEALREVCEALIATEGFKVYSHECITSFIKEISKDEYSAIIFDRYRRVRNAINYYGRQVSSEEARQAVAEISELITKLKTSLKI